MFAFLWLFSGLLGGIALACSITIEEKHTKGDGFGKFEDLNLGDIILLLFVGSIAALIGPVLLLVGVITMAVFFFMHTEKGIKIRNYKPFKGEK